MFVVDIGGGGGSSDRRLPPPPVPLECGQGDEDVAVGAALWAANGGLFYTSSKNSEFLSLRHADYSSRGVTLVKHITEKIEWDIIEISLSPNGTQMAFLANEGGAGRIYLLSTSDCTYAPIDMGSIPRGVVSGLSFSPCGNEVGFGLDSTVSPGNVFSVWVAPDFGAPGAVRQWTYSESPVDTGAFVEPEPFDYTSFDGKQVMSDEARAVLHSCLLLAAHCCFGAAAKTYALGGWAATSDEPCPPPPPPPAPPRPVATTGTCVGVVLRADSSLFLHAQRTRGPAQA